MSLFHTRLRTGLFIGFLALACTPVGLSAQSLASSPSIIRLDSLVVGYGENPWNLTSLGDGSDDWRSLFFAVDQKGTITIPDPYRARLLRFSADLSPLDPVPCPVSTPRLNFFGAASPGGYIAFTDSVFYRLDERGAVVWNAPFPLLSFPSVIFAHEGTVSIAVSGAVDMGVSSLVIEDAPPYQASLESVGGPSGKAAAAVIGASKVPFTLGDARRINPDDWPAGSDEATISAVGPDKSTWWLYRNSSSIEVVRYPPTGTPGYATIPLEPNANGFWVVIMPEAASSAIVYANRFEESSLIITRYRVVF